MSAGKPQKQALAIAYSVKRKNPRKKMAEGGSVQDEKRPMPENTYNDEKEVSHNKGNKPPGEDSFTDNPTIKQAQKPSLTRLSRPKMVGSDVFSVRDRDDVEKDLDRMNSEYPESDKAQPRKRYDEEGATRQGPDVSDMAPEHNNKKPAYTKATEDQYAQDEASDDMKKEESPLGRYAKGGYVDQPEEGGAAGNPTSRIDSGFGKVIVREAEGGLINNFESMKDAEEDNAQHPAGLEEDNDQMRPPMDEYMADHFAEGGMAHEFDDQPDEEAEIERHASIAAAIMAKRDQQRRQDSGSPDEDKAEAFYEGGQVEGSDESTSDIMSNGKEQPNAYYARNREILKENYDSDMEDVSQPEDSNEKGDSEEDQTSDPHDMVESIRRTMKARRAK